MDAAGCYIAGMRRYRPIALCLAGELGIMALLPFLGDLRRHIPLFLLLFLAAAALYLLAVRCALRLRLPFAPIFVTAIVLRIPLFFAQPSLSDDVWRYLHDGRAQLAGVNPYAFAPADARTAPFRGPEYDDINHPELRTIYPPVAQYVFRLMAATPAPLLCWRLLLLVAELVLLTAAAMLLRARGQPPANLALYAWHPLAIVETVGSAHLDPVAIAFLLLTLTALAKSRPLHAGMALAASVGAKLIAAPLLMFTLGRPRVLLAFAVTMIVLYLPFGHSGSVFGSLGVFAETWESNGSLFQLMGPFVGGWVYRWVAAALLVIILARLAWQRVSVDAAAFVYLFALFALAPVVHPWYLLWILALLPLRRVPFDAVGSAALVWTVTVSLAYSAHTQQLAHGGWRIPSLLLYLEYVPVYALLVAQNNTARRFFSMNWMPSTMKTVAKM
ncbi:MAG TPA: hypothetical protein VGD27_08940 [Longimicrobiales bacterium]